MSFNKRGSPVKAEVIKKDLKKIAEQFKKKEDQSKKAKPEQSK